MCIFLKNHHTAHIHFYRHVGNEQHLDAVYTEHYRDNIQNLCGLIYVTLYGKFPSLVHYVQLFVITTFKRQYSHKPWIFYAII